MPIIIHTKDKTLANIPFDTDENRRLLAEAPNDRRSFGASVCAIIHQQALVPDKGNFLVNPNTPTLDTTIRQQIWHEVQQKKNILVQAYPDLLGLTDGLAELDSLPWPDPTNKNLTDLITKFKTLKCPAMGTGFYVGNNLVITAAHCVEQLGPNSMGDYRLVFNFTDDKVPSTNVFSIRRLIHYNGNRQAPLAPHAPVLPPPTTLPVNSPQVDLASMVQGSETYDVAVLEILPTSNAQQLPKSLVLQPTPATPKTDVYSIGCSSGLPFIYADGSKGKAADPDAATVRRIPDQSLPLARQGSLTADIDVFKGNSGGPLFNANTNGVLGICRSGMVSPWLSDTNGPDVANDKLKNAIRNWINTKAKSPTRIFESDYLDYYVQLRALKDNSRLSWIRFKGDSGAITGVNAFSRTDPYAFLTMPLRSFLDDRKGHLSIVVDIVEGAPFNPFGVLPVLRLQGDIALVITGATIGGNTNTHQASTLRLNGGGWNGGAGEDLKWSFTTNAPGVGPPGPAPAGNPRIGTLANDLIPWAGGICSWESIGITRINNAGGGYQVGELEPLNGTVTVQFSPPHPTQNGVYLPPFVFKIQLSQFTRVAGTNDRWTTLLGGRYGGGPASWWTGPI